MSISSGIAQHTHPRGTPINPIRALVVGEALIDIIETRDGVRRVPGGSPANVALGVARLGLPSRLACWIGNDQDGATIRCKLAGSGVTVDGGTAPRTSTATAHIDHTGAATYDFDLLWDLPDLALQPSELAFHTGSIALTQQPGAVKVQSLARAAQPIATISYDPNARPAIMGDPNHAASQIDPMWDISDVVKMSNEDAAYIFDADLSDPSQRTQLADHLLSRAAQLVVFTMGEGGLQAFTREGVVATQAAIPTKVADTVGAGDTVSAALIAGLARLKLLGANQRAALGKIREKDLKRLLAYAARAAAVTVSRPGMQPPRADEVTF